MTVEEINGDYDNFPVGMRVLAVDDDPICLKLLDGLLRKCKYRVTTTSQARVALDMLRENKDSYDLVISDVHMPDMDGFKLLELVGLEMDLPVIMLSANSDPKLVMKGVTHGACDYLVKPVRIEELRNIWQHVIRRKKFDPKHQHNSSDQDNTQQGNVDGGQGPSLTGTNQSGKPNKKRKDDEDEDEDGDGDGDEENGNDSDDPATQKKPRVVWSIELHRKFVAAVNQLGIEKAVPKRILDLMNVEGLTRENVASHLQKYRLYLKRISSVATQQANMYAALGSKDPAYMRMGSLDGLGDFRALAGSGRIANTVLSPYNPGGMLGRLNSPAGLSLHNLTSSSLLPVNHAQSFSNSISTVGKLHPIVSPPSQNVNLIQGTPSALELDQLHQSNCTTLNPTDDLRMFTTGSGFTDTRTSVVSSINSLTCAPNSSRMLQENFRPLNGGGFGSQSSLNMPSFNVDSFNIGVSNSSDFLDLGRCNENWQSASQLSKTQSNSTPLPEPLSHANLPLTHVRDNQSSAVPNLLNPLEFSATSTASAPMGSTRGGLHCQEGFFADVPNMNQLQTHRWGDHKLNCSLNSENIFSSLNSLVPVNSRSQNMDQNNAIFNRRIDTDLVGQLNGGASTLLHHEEIDKSTVDARTRSNDDYLLGQMKPQATFVPHNYDSLDYLMNAMVKREQDGATLGGEFGFDTYSFGSST